MADELEVLMRYLRSRRKGGTWAPIVMGEMLAESIAERVAKRIEEAMARAPKTVILPRTQKPFTITLSKAYTFIKSEYRGYLHEFSLSSQSTNFNIYVIVDGAHKLSHSFSDLTSLSARIGMITAVQTVQGDYNFQIGGLGWTKYFELTIEPLEEITFYDVFWNYEEVVIV